MNRTRSHILALDQGTTSSRAIVFDALGQAVSVAQREFPQIYPRPGWVEHDPDAIWKTQLNTARRALRLAKLSAGDVAAIGITNQRETTLIWDRATGKPIANAIVWQDRRTADICDALRKDKADRLVRRKTGLELDAYSAQQKFSGCSTRQRAHGPRREPAALPSVPLTLGWSGISPADKPTSPTFPTPRGRCFSTSAPATGMMSC